MAKQGAIRLNLTLENLIYYSRLGGWYVRSKPENIKQTTATKQAGNNFGKANKTESNLRNTLLSIIPNSKDKTMQRRFAKAVYQWLNKDPLNTNLPVDKLPFITGYEYNENSCLKESLRLPISVSRTPLGKLDLHIPAFRPTQAITAPPNTQMIVCNVMAAACDMQNGAATAKYNTRIVIPYVNASISDRDYLLDIDTAPGCLTVVAISLEYHTVVDGIENVITNLRWMPAGIVEAMYN